jgi:hypothetical protein
VPRDNQDENAAARLMMSMLIDAGERYLPAARQSGWEQRVSR